MTTPYRFRRLLIMSYVTSCDTDVFWM